MNRPKRIPCPWIPKKQNTGIINRQRDPVYHTNRWKKESRQFLDENPLCIECQKKGLLVPAKVTDHIIPKNKCSDIWDQSNWRPLCFTCHMKKSATDRNYFK